MKILEYISEYRYWNRLINRNRKIDRLHGKWNAASMKLYNLEQHFPAYCKEQLEDYCRGCSVQLKYCGRYSLEKKYRKYQRKCEEFAKKLKALEKERN